MYSFTNYTKQDTIKAVVGLTIANILMLNTFSMIGFIIWGTLSGVIFTEPYFTILIIQSAIVAPTLALFGSTLTTLRFKTSLRGEILGDWIIIKSQFGKSTSWRSTCKSVNSFVIYYHLVLPVVIYTLIRYRTAHTFTLDPAQFNLTYDADRCPGNVVFKLLDNTYASGNITEPDLHDHFFKLGNRYFVKDSNSALYLKLSYPPKKLLLAFKIDNSEVTCVLLDMLKADADLSDFAAEKIINSSFTIA